MFPDIIKKMHADNYGVEGLEVYFDHTPIGTIYFFATKNEFFAEFGYVDDPNYS